MKKILSIAIILSVCLNMNAQFLFDALRFSNNSIIDGSARYMGMAGAFGALGGDVSASIDNPAALGIFRSSEVGVSLGFSPTITNSNWQGDKYSDNITCFDFNHVSWVFNIPSYRESGYLSTSLGFSYHKIKDFNRKVYLQSNSNSVVSLTDLMAGYLNRNNGDMIFKDDLLNENAYDDTRLDWLSVLGFDAGLIKTDDAGTSGQWYSMLGNENVLPAYEALERGNVSDYNFTYSGNISDRVYFGAGFSMQSISYEMQSIYNEDYPEHGDNFNLKNHFMTKGYGINVKFGAIVRATNFMRFGLSVQTPTSYSFKEWHSADLKYSQNTYSVSTPEAGYWYNLTAPVKAQASVGFIIGKRAAIDVDYQFSGKKYVESDDYGKFNVDNDKEAKYMHSVKLGAEIRLGENFKIRAGGAFITEPIKQNAVKFFPYPTTRTDYECFVPENTYYGTFGVGYAKNRFAIDLAYAYQQQNQTFYAAENFDNFGATLKTHTHNIIATVAFRY